ncbi:MAG: hypothetical protein LQ349_004478 [Xanthoria aureola]|nr:MAG: hypothetical protein LQ349_004478 [Xanthoria aureola]
MPSSTRNCPPERHDGFVSYGDFVDACSTLSSTRNASRSGSTSFETVGEEDCRYLVISNKTTEDDVVQRPGLAMHSQDVDDLTTEDIETYDEAAIHHASASEHLPSVQYDVVHSQSYQVPVLYFHYHDAAHAHKLLHRVYDALVPKNHAPGLRAVGILGAISMGNHPMTGTPACFIHPCNTAEALRQIIDGRLVSSLEYLQIWFGLVGPSVGLYLPTELVAKSMDKDWKGL